MSRRPLVVLEALQVRERPTGVGTATLGLLQGLAAEDRGCDFAVLASRPEMFDFCAGQPGWRVVACPGARGGPWRRAWYLQREVPRLVARLGGDLLHSLQFLAPLGGGVPNVVSVHDLSWLNHPDTVEWTRRLYYRLVVPGTLRRARAILAVSSATAHDLATHFPGAAPRTRVVPHGVPGWVGTSLREPREGNGEHFLFVGALEPRKNLVRILDAYRVLLEERGSAAVPDLVLAGPPGWRNGSIRDRLKGLEGTGKVRTTGYGSPGELRILYDDALALVFPSLEEGFGLPILEAMALGVPVLTSDRGATAEVAGDAALLVDPGDTAGLASAMGRIWDEPGLRKRLVKAGLDRVRAFDWKRTAELTLDAYRDVLAEAGIRF